MTIYIDLIILSNFLLDYSLITYTGLITNEKLKYTRIIIATLFATAGLVLFFVHIKWIFLILRILWGFVIIFLAFDFKSIKHYLKNCFIFYILNYLLAGIIISYDFQFTNQTIVVDLTNQVTWYFLVVSFLFAVILTYIYKVIIDTQLRYKSTIFDVTFSLLNKEYYVKGLMDTGNMVTSLKEHIPVIFLDEDLIQEEINDVYLLENNVKFTYVVYKTLKQSYTTLAFKPDYFRVKIDNSFQDKNVYIALIKDLKKMEEDYQLILNAILFT